jgi:undecaprenyl-diphosphatase
MPAMEAKTSLLFVAFLAGAALLVWGGSNGRWAAATALLAIFLADQAAGLVKFLVARPRPCHVLSAVTLLNTGCTGSYAFPSNHATNLFALAVVVGCLYPRWAWAFLTFAAAVSYARVYGGAHYPGDVLGGALLGAALGALAVAVTQAARRALGRTARASATTTAEP